MQLCKIIKSIKTGVKRQCITILQNENYNEPSHPYKLNYVMRPGESMINGLDEWHDFLDFNNI